MVLSLISIKTSLVVSQFVCTGMYFPIPAGIKHSSFAYTPMSSSVLSFNTLIFIYSRGILQTWVDIFCSSVALQTFPDLLLAKLLHPPSTNQAFKADSSFTGINATSSSVHTNLRLFILKNDIPKFWL